MIRFRQLFKPKYVIEDAFSDFILSREAMRCTPATLETYSYTAGFFVKWLLSMQVNITSDIRSEHIRLYLSELTKRGLSSYTIHGHARAIRTLLIFWHSEGYIEHRISFPMPLLEKKRLPVLNINDLNMLLEACRSQRDKVIILLLVDTGIRRAEACRLNWGDVIYETGTIRIINGKGGKSRTVVMGGITKKELLLYQRTVPHARLDPLFQTRNGGRLSPGGLRMVIRRLSARTGIHVSPHVLRRTFATLSTRAGMNILHLQHLMGHSTLEMTRHYTILVEDDLIQAHNESGPLDKLLYA